MHERLNVRTIITSTLGGLCDKKIERFERKRLQTNVVYNVPPIFTYKNNIHYDAKHDC